jgi:hypothetical protein
MATITDPALVRVIGERIRPAAESIYGLAAMGQDDQPILTALAAGVPNDGTILDGADVSTFTGADFQLYVGLMGTLLAAAANPAVQAAVGAAKVRPLSSILAGSTPSDDPTVSGVVNAIRLRIRPRCQAMRALRYRMQNHLNVVPPLLTAYQSADVIDDGRTAEGIAPLTVGQVQTLLGFMAAMIDPSVNTAAVALMVDYGAGTPLVVS